MLNRRHLRIKVLQALYAYFQGDEDSIKKTENELIQAVDRIYDLYLYLLLSFGELKDIAEHRIEENKKKIRPAEEDLNPNRKFVDSVIIQTLQDSYSLREASEDRTVNWIGDEHHEMFRKIYIQMREGETWFAHMSNELTGFEEDKNFMINLFKAEIANSPLIYHFFEEKSIHWLDDIDLACQMVIKSLKAMEEGEKFVAMPLYKDKEDEQEFIRTLLRKTISMDSENLKLIDELTDNWELERIAKMDILLLKMAITELQVFKSIPKKVTLNEYIEISKFYSTPKSHGFINGILDKAVDRLVKDGKIAKLGRGLMD
ncbi:MAG: NusB antitermination factor [Fluviicola sp.]|jgi:N utilization substance protein B|uniref:transcription antitermination factor NusB n=1 Tax=Fluviicola sp. TaxID=1917219 RepID=UPI0026084C8F|nr:transcription antitermination factor NusB [Fluviicola sp.]MDF3026358.1 NusB antitermination factor [Fluviicola sp.]